MTYKIAITHPIPEHGIIELLKDGKYHVQINSCHKNLSCSELSCCGKGAYAIVPIFTDKIDDRVMEAAGDSLKIISTYSVGYDHIDLVAATKRGIAVTNTPDVAAISVAEFAVGLMLDCAKKITLSDKFVRAGKYIRWDPNGFLGTEMHGKILGIVGCGNIGSYMAKICHNGLGMKIIYFDIAKNNNLEHDTGAYQVSFDKLLEKSDIVSLHVPLTPKTKHMINAKSLKKMKKSAILINTARGPVVDERALVGALKNEIISGAGLDVFENDPKLTPGLKNLQNVIITPHIASSTIETRTKMGEIVVENIKSMIDGRIPPNLVNKEVESKLFGKEE